MLKRNGQVYTQIVKACSASELLPIIRNLSDMSKTEFYSDCWLAYDGLVDFLLRATHSSLCKKEQSYRVRHRENEFAKGTNHINGIDNF